MTVAAKNYVASLDGLRAFAVGMVLLHHISGRLAPDGRIGVDIFFVLSGFLITSVLLREVHSSGRIKLGQFYLRRTLRLAPAFIVFLACNGIFVYFFGGPARSEFWSFISALTYTMDFTRAFQLIPQDTLVGHTWSLAIEEQFYLLWPAALLLLLKIKPGRRLLFVGGLIVLVNIWRLHLVAAGAPLDRFYYPLDTRADQLLMGCWLALWLNAKPSERLTSAIARFWPLAALGILAIARWDVFDRPGVQGLEYGVVGLLSAVLILQAYRGGSPILKTVLSFPPIVWIGQISYGIYLWHYPILLQTRYRTDSKSAVILCAGFAVLAAALSYWFVEKPFLRLKSRIESPDISADPDGVGRASQTSLSADRKQKALRPDERPTPTGADLSRTS